LLFLSKEALDDFQGKLCLIHKKSKLKYLKTCFHFKGVDTSNPNAVLIGLAPEKFNYEHLNEAFR
jgi:hypothetical protein